MAHQRQRSSSTSNSPPPTSTKSAAARLPTISSGSGGGNTELRAQIRREREASKTNALGVVKREPSGSSIASMAAPSMTRQHTQQMSDNDTTAIAGPSQLDRRTSSTHLDSYAAPPAAIPPSSSAGSMTAAAEPRIPASTSKAAKRLSTGSAVAAAVRKLEEDAKARDAGHGVFSITRSGSTGSTKGPPRERRSTDEIALETAIPESYDHSFGIETLSAAFSAKYYELANKCKSWERYAAQLRARAEALDIDNRILRESSERQERHVVALEAENAVLRSQNEQREARAREVEARLTHLEAHVAEADQRRGPSNESSATGSSQCGSSPSPPGHSAYHSSNLAKSQSSGERERHRAPTPLSGSHDRCEYDAGQITLPAQVQRPKRPLSMGLNDHYTHLQNVSHLTSAPMMHAPAASSSSVTLHSQYALGSGSQAHAALPKRRSVNSFDPDVVKSSASLPVLYLGSAGVARSRGMSVSSTMSEATMVAPPYVAASQRSSSVLGGGMPHTRAETVGADGSHTGSLNGRRRLRRTSLNQQQQLAALQAQRDTSASSSSRPPSRTASRMSARTGRSRAGSATVHDSIPAVKDDMFSSSSASLSSGREAITHSQSQPLLNNRTASSGSLGPPAATVAPHAHTIHLAAAAGQRGHTPLVPLHQWTNVEGRANVASTSGYAHPHYTASASDGILMSSQGYPHHALSHHHSQQHLASTTSHPLFARQPSSASLGSSSILTRTSSSGEIALPKIEDGDEGAAELSEVASGRGQDTDAENQPLSARGALHAQARSSEDEPALSSSDCGAASSSEEDKRGAHRRLYIALRSELGATDLAKFERYVHRYDALEIPIDGPRGLVNRVKKLLLLADPTLRERPADLKRRKELAREFERIVRVDLGTPSAAVAA